MPAARALNAAQERFCQEYLVDLSAKGAYQRAYPDAKPKTAEANGCRLLGNAKVAARIAGLQAKRAKRVETTVDRVLTEIDALALSDIGDIVEFSGEHGIRFKSADEIPEYARRAIASVKVKRYPNRDDPTETYDLVEFKLWDKVAAQRLALQHRGRLTEKVEHTGKDGGPIEVRSLTPAERVTRVQELLETARTRKASNGNGTHP